MKCKAIPMDGNVRVQQAHLFRLPTCPYENDIQKCIHLRRENTANRCQNCKQGRENEVKFRNINEVPRKEYSLGAGKIEWERLGKIEEARRAEEKARLQKYRIPKKKGQRKGILLSAIGAFRGFECRF